MNLPEQVVQQMENAAKLQNELYGQKEAPAPAEITPELVAEAQPEVAPETVSEPKVEPVKEQPTDDFKHQYDVLKGKYSAEVPRLHQALKEREAQLNELMARLDKLEKQPEQKEESLLTDKDGEDFGTDLVDMARRAATEVFRRESAKLFAEIDKRLNSVASEVVEVKSQVVQSSADKFWGRVTELVPDWPAIDANPDWFAFLDSTPEFTTETYRSLAGRAIADGDHEKIAKLVKVWRGDTQQAPAAPKQPNPDLQRQVAPNTAKTSTPPSPQKVWTGAEYEYIFSQKAMNDMSPKQLEQFQADAQLALAEGRVRW
jgi:tetrahydromethanopterin S-methyltransferase subunit G